MSTVNKALNNLGFNSNDFVLQNNDGVDEIIEWHSKLPQPTQEAIDQAKIDWQAEQNATQYQRDRAAEYPSWQEQMDMMYHDQTEGSRTWLDAVEAVKEAYPK